MYDINLLTFHIIKQHYSFGSVSLLSVLSWVLLINNVILVTRNVFKNETKETSFMMKSVFCFANFLSLYMYTPKDALLTDLLLYGMGTNGKNLYTDISIGHPCARFHVSHASSNQTQRRIRNTVEYAQTLEPHFFL